MRKSIIALSLLGAVVGLAGVVPAEAAPRGPVRFFDERGQDRGYLWCLQAGLQIFDCNYFTKAQCDMSASARRVWCVVNPFAVVQGYGPYGGPAPTVGKRQRQVY